MSETDFHHGSMDVSQNAATWASFVTLVKWATLAIAILAVIAVIAVQ